MNLPRTRCGICLSPVRRCAGKQQVLVVRNDLKMGKGKIAAQCRSICNSQFPFL